MPKLKFIKVRPRILVSIPESKVSKLGPGSIEVEFEFETLALAFEFETLAPIKTRLGILIPTPLSIKIKPGSIDKHRTPVLGPEPFKVEPETSKPLALVLAPGLSRSDQGWMLVLMAGT